MDEDGRSEQEDESEQTSSPAYYLYEHFDRGLNGLNVAQTTCLWIAAIAITVLVVVVA